MDGLNARLISIEQVNDLYLHNTKTADTEDTTEHESFQEIFAAKTNPESDDVKFSKHANQRLESRNITLSPSQKLRLNEGVERARDKSINDTLVMMDNLAFIVNVKNNTVVTALEQNEDSNVFTNIDGAVIV
ncbi:MAG: flagellar protein [Lachnospiraceae bacterium]|nr:flagellar protein [Lachnospiraceae bacterium]